MRSIVCIITAGMLLAGHAFAQQGAMQGQAQWGEVKALYQGTEIRGEKVMFPSPWPFAYVVDGAIDDTSAKLAMMQVGLTDLMACSDILVVGQVPVGGVVEIAIVQCLRPNGKYGFWLVDLLERAVAEEYEFTSLELNSLELVKIGTSETVTLADLDEIADDEDIQNHLELTVETYLGDIEGTDGFWDRVKEGWNDLRPCQQQTAIAGAIVCGTAALAAGLAGVACGVGFLIVGLGC